MAGGASLHGSSIRNMASLPELFLVPEPDIPDAIHQTPHISHIVRATNKPTPKPCKDLRNAT